MFSLKLNTFIIKLFQSSISSTLCWAHNFIYYFLLPKVRVLHFICEIIFFYFFFKSNTKMYNKKIQMKKFVYWKRRSFFVGVVVYTSPRSDTATKLRYSSTPSNNVIGWPCKRDVFCCIAAIVPFAVPIRWQDATIRTCNTIILVKESCNIHNAEFWVSSIKLKLGS